MTSFVKMHGQGNNFIILDRRGADMRPVSPEAARILADRRLGVGCDQLLVIGDIDDGADIRMDVFNQDGSVSNACGNGTRCVGAFVMQQMGTKSVTIRTGAGHLIAWRPVDTSWEGVPLAHECDTLSVDLGIDLKAIEGLGFDGRDFEWIAGDGRGRAVCHSVGNPHAVLFVEDADAVDLETIGPMVESLDIFPERVNFSVVSQLPMEGRFLESKAPAAGLPFPPEYGIFRMRVWERGVGITSACGSGACAVGVAAHRRGLGPLVNFITMDGGQVQVEWREDSNHVWLVGGVDYVFEGQLSNELTQMLEAG